MCFSLLSIKCSLAPPSFRLLPSTWWSNCCAEFKQRTEFSSTRKLRGPTEHLRKIHLSVELLILESACYWKVQYYSPKWRWIMVDIYRAAMFEARCAVKGLLFSNFCIDLYGYVYSCRCLFFFLRIDGFLSSVFFLCGLQTDWLIFHACKAG